MCLLFTVTFATKIVDPLNSYFHGSETKASIIINLILLATKLSLNEIMF